jgi:YidC/Oxa1 family membrane protein insertase
MSSMQIRKIVLYALLVAVGLLIYNAYEKQSVQLDIKRMVQSSAVQAQDQNITASTSTVSPSASYVPKAFTPSSGSAASNQDQSHPIAPAAPKVTNENNNPVVTVQTSTLNVGIDLTTGSIHTLSLPGYPISLSDKNPFVLFAQDDYHNYQTQSGLVDTQGKPLAVNYQSSQTHYILGSNQEALNVVLNGQTTNGLSLTKTYTFHKNSYVIDVSYQVQNKGKNPQNYSFYGQLTRQPSLLKGSVVSNRAYKGAAISSPDDPYEEIKYDWLDGNQLDRQIQGGWIAQQEQYFITAWIPTAHVQNNYYSHTDFQIDSEGKAANIYTVGFTAPAVTIEPGQTATIAARLYAGPEIASVLKTVAPGLDLSVDYGWLWMLSKLIFTIMAYIETVVHNWGFAIILTTLLIKLCFYKLSEHSYKSMAKMKKFAPKIQALKEQFGDNKAELGKATMELYRKEKVNPAGGCLPMVVQIPFFFALYYVLINSVELRQAPFIFWVKDLAIYDPYYVLPVLVGFSMFLQQKMSPPPPDPAQAKMMMFLPVIFTVFFARFPAGLTLYWLTNNLLTVLQQWYVMRKFDNPDYVKKQVKLERQKAKALSSKK